MNTPELIEAYIATLKALHCTDTEAWPAPTGLAVGSTTVDISILPEKHRRAILELTITALCVELRTLGYRVPKGDNTTG
jgi:hypothetical protein